MCCASNDGYVYEQIQKRKVVVQAIELAKEKQTEVGVYKEGKEWKFGIASQLRAIGIEFREVYNQYS